MIHNNKEIWERMLSLCTHYKIHNYKKSKKHKHTHTQTQYTSSGEGHY